MDVGVDDWARSSIDHSPGAFPRVTTVSERRRKSLEIDSHDIPCSVTPTLEVEAELHGFGSRRDVVRPAERGEEVVQRHLVRQVDDREAQTPLVTVTVEEVISAHAGIKQIPWCNPLRVVVVVFLARRRYPDKLRPKL